MPLLGDIFLGYIVKDITVSLSISVVLSDISPFIPFCPYETLPSISASTEAY